MLGTLPRDRMACERGRERCNVTLRENREEPRADVRMPHVNELSLTYARRWNNYAYDLSRDQQWLVAFVAYECSHVELPISIDAQFPT